MGLSVGDSTDKAVHLAAVSPVSMEDGQEGNAAQTQ